MSKISLKYSPDSVPELRKESVILRVKYKVLPRIHDDSIMKLAAAKHYGGFHA